MTTMAQPTTRTAGRARRHLTYDVRAVTRWRRSALLLIGSPMGAGGFPTLAAHFTDRTVITYDPRGVERSTKADPASESTPDQHADDLHRVIAALGVGPVDLFASSGGAVNALALVARHPEQVRTLVAHEPPLASILPDREGAMAVTQASTTPTEARLGARHGAIHRQAVSYEGAMTPRARRPAGPRSGDVRAARRGRRHPDRPAARPEHRDLHPLRARLRCPSRGVDPDRDRGRRRIRRRDGRIAGRAPSPSGSARRR